MFSSLDTTSCLTNAFATVIPASEVNSFNCTVALLNLPASIFSYNVCNSLGVYLDSTPLIHSIILVKNDLISVLVLVLLGSFLNASN